MSTNQVWELVGIPNGVKIVGYDGSPRLSVTLMGKSDIMLGSQQNGLYYKGVEYNEAF